MKHAKLLALPLALLLMNGACSPSQESLGLTGITLATTAALVALQQNKAITPAQLATFQAFASQVATAAHLTITEAATGDTAANKALYIGQVWLTAASQANALPPADQIYAQDTITLIQEFLTLYGPPPAATAHAHAQTAKPAGWSPAAQTIFAKYHAKPVSAATLNRQIDALKTSATPPNETGTIAP